MTCFNIVVSSNESVTADMSLNAEHFIYHQAVHQLQAGNVNIWALDETTVLWSNIVESAITYARPISKVS